MLATLSRWMREGPVAHLLPWRFEAPLERATVRHAYPDVPGPLRWQLGDGPPEVNLLFGGDLALHRWAPGDDVTAVVGGLDPLLGAVDGCFLNLETQLTARTSAAGTIGSSLRADPSALAVLSRLRLWAVSCANNHCLDFGTEGLAESVDRLEEAGIGVTGVSRPGRDGGHVAVVRGVRIGLLAFTDDWRVQDGTAGPVGPVPHRPELVRARIAAMKPRADLVVVQLHWGYEWSMYPMLSQRNLAREYAEAGAGLVLCHHAHVPMGVEQWRGSLIAHGLGNFYFGPSSREAHPFRNASHALRVGLSSGAVVEATAVPIHTLRDGRLVHASEPMAGAMTRSLAYLSRRLGEDRYLAAVERSLMARQGCLVLLDLARRIAEGDWPGARERVRFLDPPRQQQLIASLVEAGGIQRHLGALLARVHDRSTELQGSTLASEIVAMAIPVRRYLATTRQKGRIP